MTNSKRHLKSLKRSKRKELRQNNIKRIIDKYGDQAFKSSKNFDQVQPGENVALTSEQVNQIFGLLPEELEEKKNKAKIEAESAAEERTDA